jgi:hypothetical protein
MGTKANPGPFDCYAKARPDEEIFILLDRDPLAPFLVSIWSSIRYGDREAAQVKFAAMMEKIAPRYAVNPDVAAASDALECAMAMFRKQASR